MSDTPRTNEATQEVVGKDKNTGDVVTNPKISWATQLHTVHTYPIIRASSGSAPAFHSCWPTVPIPNRSARIPTYPSPEPGSHPEARMQATHPLQPAMAEHFIRHGARTSASRSRSCENRRGANSMMTYGGLFIPSL